MWYFNFLNLFDYNNYSFSNISILSVIAYLSCVISVNLPFFYFKKQLLLEDLSNLIPILLKSYFGSILLGAAFALFFEFLQGFFFTNIDILGEYLNYVFLLTILSIINYITIRYYSSCQLIIREDDTNYYISNLENDKKRDNYINTLKEQQISKKKQNWLILKKIMIYCFLIFCFSYFSLGIIVAYIMFG